jgi:GT2 family glycosyltransferase
MGLISDDYRKNFEKAFMPAKTDIVVLSYGQEDKTIRCFEAIAKNTDNYRVIWVDNGSGQESIEKVKPAAAKLLDCDLISVPQNEGFTKGVNRALRKIIGDSSAPYIALLNNDVVVTPGWLHGLVSAQVSAGFDAIGPLTSENNPHSLDAFRPVVPTLPAFDESVNIDTRADTLRSMYGSQNLQAGDMLSFFCCLLRREAVEQVGLLDEGLFAYGEDNDYFKRMKITGHKFGIALGVYVHHDHGVTTDSMGDGWGDKMRQKAKKYLAEKWKRLGTGVLPETLPDTKLSSER